MDADLINGFISSALFVLEQNASTKAIPRKPYLKKDLVAQGDISGIVTMSGELEGTVAVSFSEKCILQIVSNMFMEEMTEMGDDIKDAVGELANQIAGQATQKFTQDGKSQKATLSTVLMGKNHVIDHLANRPVVALPFGTDAGDFTIEICFEK